MRLRKKKSLLEQATESVESYVGVVRPQVEQAVAHARGAVHDFVDDTARPTIADARAKAGPVLADAREKAVAQALEAKDKAGPVIADARAKAAPVIASGVALASEKAAAAKSAADVKLAELTATEPPPEKKGGRLRKVALVALVAGAAGFVAKKIQAGRTDSWQSSYVPAPPPAGPTSPRAPGAPKVTPEDDAGGASPDEALADQAEAPHTPTTPDAPAEVVDLDEQRRS
ncbi:hypothetical protein [Nocardioides sp. zg-DK7169]|uniref:hypothetical protein n=1 Tax=Nocardioides sp. zg-DK7169 TaxID=2736600 RepID=UPI0015577FB5|nr:hypothetical protein [Nocardioides sp. zg-DK7169]NPC98795.1 hypothetical protein [Nocardioides sp. zg-DK7169]